MSQQLILQVLSILTGLFCLFIAARLGRRKFESRDDQFAWTAFRIWWLGIGISTALGALRALMVASGVQSLAPYMAQSLVNTAILIVAFWGLLFYLIYLYVGRRSWAIPLGVFYALFFIGLLAYTFVVLQPTGVTIADGAATVTNANQPDPIYAIVTILLLLAPPIIAALVYFSLYFRVRENQQKYRVLLVSVSILVWFGSPLIGWALGATSADWWTYASRVIGLLAVLVIYWAYYPPQFIQQRFKVASI
jgi:hypothetical protein